ncbi:MAG: ATP synthase subunit [Bacteroidetes bacterium 4572_77]|nr:MAG: ATP synthase subunit [Bacteroidetes bacterium 4572_77]
MKKNFRIYDNLALVSQIGIMTALPIIGGVYFGKILDEKFNADGKILLIFIILGTGSAFFELIRFTLKKAQKDAEKNKKEREDRRRNR